MSLYVYHGRLADGTAKQGKVTAKSEATARSRIEAQHAGIMLDALTVSTESPAAIAATESSGKTKPMSKLQRLLYLQHGRCFFCGEPLQAGEASIEHLHPKAKGGTNGEDNEVVCHASLNQAFGSMGLKAKFTFVLRYPGPFTCPR
ncbi:hypothetical protein ASA1KI_33550 [Opitutales bacterium ASA1]|uniref:HNH endonuclease n=1 Tax=Congregicoccus parvus TaxID=3081749 RepID=UPI002B293962|nr:hypothetical protein ASA1KI_33550 [Opitutales bacterium ASA1]